LAGKLKNSNFSGDYLSLQKKLRDEWKIIEDPLKELVK